MSCKLEGASIRRAGTMGAAFALAAVAFLPGNAEARPDIAAQTGKPCSACHVGGAGTNGTLNGGGRAYQQCGQVNCNSSAPSQPRAPAQNQNRPLFPSTVLPQNQPVPQPQNPFFPSPSYQPPAYQPYQPQPYYQPPSYQAPSYQPPAYQQQPYYQQPPSAYPYQQPYQAPSSPQPYQNSPTPWR